MFLKYFLHTVLFISLFSNFLLISAAKEKAPCIQQLTEPLNHGEEPTWDVRTQLLYFVDLHRGLVFSYDPVTTALHHIKLNGAVTPVIPTKYDTDVFIVGVNRTLTAIKWNPRSNLLSARGPLTTVAQEYPTSRFNDGKADADGRLWIGTMGYEDANGVVPNEGSLYLITQSDLSQPEKVITPVNISNGLAWNKANTKFFYIDTPTRQVRMYDFDLEAGTISNPKVVFDVRNYDEITGNPDGMTIDENDNIWVALFNGGAVVHVDTKTSKLLRVVPIPALKVTSVSWGSKNLDVLYVTTSRVGLTEEETKSQPAAGALFAVYGLGTNGLPAYNADILDSKKLSCFE